MTNSNGIIIILHSIHRTISEDEIRPSIPDDYEDRPHKFISVEPAVFDIKESWKQDFPILATKQHNQYRKEIKPLIDDPSYSKIIYFGAAPIPLAMHLGHLIGDFEDIEVFQHHHDLKTWDWQLGEQDSITIKTENKPKDLFHADGDVSILMSTSVRVNEVQYQEVLPASIKNIHIHTSEFGRDIFTNPRKLSETAAHFRDVLDSIKSNLPNTDYIHFFGAIPVGLAFLLGTKISSSIHNPVQTYQYKHDATPKYSPAILIQSADSPLAILSDEEIQEAKELRQSLDEMLQNEVAAFISTIRDSAQDTWFNSVLPSGTDDKLFSIPFWSDLPMISELRLEGDTIPAEPDTSIGEGFSYNSLSHAWILLDSFVTLLRKMFEDENDFKRAIRMFLFHESLHYTKHNLTSSTVIGIGNFPKILEEADYQADVWAIFHEYKYSSLRDRVVSANSKAYFLKLIDIALNTMWSFYPQETTIRQMQVRRINRFLMWYWQFLRIENLPHESSIDEIVSVLLRKPSIELSGPAIKSYNQRTFFDLTISNLAVPELAVFQDNRVYRFGQMSSLNIIGLIHSFTQKESETIKSQLRAVVESVTAIN